GNVDNTSDANKPVSSAQATINATKAPLASPTFTGTVSGITKAMVGLVNVDNTSDVNKPVSTATATAIAGKYTLPAGGITTSDLASSVVSTLNLASTAYQKPTSGVPFGDLSSQVQSLMSSNFQRAPLTAQKSSTTATLAADSTMVLPVLANATYQGEIVL